MEDARALDMERLRASIAALEKRPPLAESIVRQGHSGTAKPAAGLFPAPAGLLHEVFADTQRDGGGALGFAFGMARPLLSAQRPALIYLQLTADTQELGFPYAGGFSLLGITAEQVLLLRVESMTELLWAMEEALTCRAVAAVIADVAGHHRMLDFTVSRRLSLRTSATQASVFMLRYDEGREASAAALRWRIAPSLSSAPFFDPHAPGPPRFEVTLEKSRLGTRTARLEGTNYLLDWVDHGFVVVERDGAQRAAAGHPAIPGAQPAALGDRLSQAS